MLVAKPVRASIQNGCRVGRSSIGSSAACRPSQIIFAPSAPRADRRRSSGPRPRRSSRPASPGPTDDRRGRLDAAEDQAGADRLAPVRAVQRRALDPRPRRRHRWTWPGPGGPWRGGSCATKRGSKATSIAAAWRWVRRAGWKGPALILAAPRSRVGRGVRSRYFRQRFLIFFFFFFFFFFFKKTIKVNPARLARATPPLRKAIPPVRVTTVAKSRVACYVRSRMAAQGVAGAGCARLSGPATP